MSIVKLNRRDFVRFATAAGAGLALAPLIPLSGAESKKSEEYPLGAFVHVGIDGIVTVYVSKSEMGQGVRTALPMIIAEELDADWSRVRIRQADFDQKYGRMGTGGSGSIRSMWTPLRQAGATARAMLVSAAAVKLGVDAKDIVVQNGVIRGGGKKLSFADVAAEASKLEVPKNVALKDPAKFAIIGRKANRIDNPDLLLGKSQYGIDVKVPGMLYAAIARSPVFGGKAVSVDDTKAKAVPGVKHVVKIDASGTDLPWNGVGVVADSTWAAMKGRDALIITWDKGTETTAALFTEMRELVAKDANRVRNDGDVEAALSSAAKKVEATYEAPYLAHATMEPMTATVSVTAEGAEIWAPTQFPNWAGSAVASFLKLKPEQIKVHVTLLGGGFGRRANPDFVLEAAALSKAVSAPVKVQWTRADDMQHDFYRPPSVHRLAAALDANGNVTAWHHRMASPSITGYFEADKPEKAHDSEVGGLEDLPHKIANFRLEYALAKSAVPRGWWRSVESSVNAFVAQGFIDELAHAAGKDPIEFQLALLPAGEKKGPAEGPGKDYPYESDRLRRVIELVRDKSGWGKPLPAGRARGFAAWYSFLSYVAEVAEVSIVGGEIKVHRIVAAVDCGVPINPDGIAAQVEGSIVYGLTAAFKGEITLDGGAVQQSNFHDYPLMTIAEMPKVVEVHVVPSTALPTGTGEPGLPPAAPAVANAVFQLTGKRLRSMPFKL